jgi:diguanylate cyclase (GGDEF)-like protein
MHGNRLNLRVLYLTLCALQLAVTGTGLAVAYQAQRAYSRNIDDEIAVNAARRALTELETLARVASPDSLDLDDASGLAQWSQVEYAAGIFLRKTKQLLDQSEHLPNSILEPAKPNLLALIAETNTVVEQTRLATEAASGKETAQMRARLTYASRAAARVQTILTSVSQDMGRTKDEVLLREAAEARAARSFLLPLSVVGALLVFPALLYARSLDKNIWNYETELENERNLLEKRVATRTSELRGEIENRNRIETFNDSRNGLLEKVAEGIELNEILTQLACATEASVQGSRCLILLGEGVGRFAVAPNLPIALTANLLSGLFPGSGGDGSEDATKMQEGHPVFIAYSGADAQSRFAGVWAEGFHGIYAVLITEPRHAASGAIVLLLPEDKEPDQFARQVLLSASRVAAIALKHQQLQDELFRRAHHDPLTNLPNRLLFEDRLQQAIARARRHGSVVAVLCIDLDGFKQINDRYGHHAGDWLLQRVAQRIVSRLRVTDTVSRIGGDEFVAVLDDVRSESFAAVIDSLVREIAEPFAFGNVTLRTTASIGAALFPADGMAGATLQRHADIAMYHAKERGRNTFQIFSADLVQGLARRHRVERDLQEALDHDGFELYYQPIYTTSRQVVGLEALIRFGQPKLKSISPAEFIPVAEQTGLISKIGEWVLREACRQGRKWQQEGFTAIPIAVNVSAVQLARADFAGQVSAILQETNLKPACLRIEVTETAIMSDFEEGSRQLDALESLGVQISLDDFGTGHSSLSYIHRLPIDILKIDRSFVQQMADSPESEAIVRAIIAMAEALDLTVVAEGVETQEQLKALVAAGCNLAQGYLFAKPMDCSSVTELLRENAGETPAEVIRATETPASDPGDDGSIG